ncbi:MAG: NTP transferase domain-containing protein, partial [Myxococcales bacterium]
PYQAVILAAGRGSRLAEHTREMPKALLPIGPRSASDPTETNFLRRQVELLREHGVEQIVVVVGTLREMVEQEVARWERPVPLVVNPTPDIATSGSLHSFQFAVRSEHGILDGGKQTLLMDADIVYHRRALSQFLQSPEHSALMISARHTGDGEEVLAYGALECPRFLGKALTPALVDGEPCLGEATGIVKFAPADHELARATIDWMLGDPDAPEGTPRHRGYGPARRATEHEELTQRFMRYGRMRGERFGEDLPFMECDDAAEYARLRERFYPALLEMEAREAAAGSQP